MQLQCDISLNTCPKEERPKKRRENAPLLYPQIGAYLSSSAESLRRIRNGISRLQMQIDWSTNKAIIYNHEVLFFSSEVMNFCNDSRLFISLKSCLLAMSFATISKSAFLKIGFILPFLTLNSTKSTNIYRSETRCRPHL